MGFQTLLECSVLQQLDTIMLGKGNVGLDEVHGQVASIACLMDYDGHMHTKVSP